MNHDNHHSDHLNNEIHNKLEENIIQSNTTHHENIDDRVNPNGIKILVTIGVIIFLIIAAIVFISAKHSNAHIEAPGNNFYKHNNYQNSMNHLNPSSGTGTYPIYTNM